MSNSHYVPRLVLRKFSDKLCLYNLKTGELKENISPEHAYAIQGFYDNETEKKLNLKIESQFGGLLSNLILKSERELSLSRVDLLLVKKFLMISIIRSIKGEEWTWKEKDFYNRLDKNNHPTTFSASLLAIVPRKRYNYGTEKFMRGVKICSNDSFLTTNRT